jgi:hypothetical protein
LRILGALLDRQTVTLQTLAKNFRARGIPVFMAGESVAKSAVRAASSQMGRQIMRGILGSFMGGARR